MRLRAPEQAPMFVLCALVLLGLVILDIVHVGGLVLSGSYALSAVLASVVLTARQTIYLAAASVVLSVLSFLWNDNLGEFEWWLRLGVNLAFAALAVLAVRARDRRERKLTRMTLIAETAQSAVLRSLPPAIGPVGFAARYVSASEEARIGGDLYEVIATPFGTRAIVGDVRGKGLDAVQLTATVLAAFRHSALQRPDLSDVAGDLDAVVAGVGGEEDFVTSVIVQFTEDDGLDVVNLGHLPPVLVRRPGTGPELMDTGEPVQPLGLHPTPVVVSTRWPPGARLLLYTDGTTESRDRQGRFFELTSQAADLADGTLDEALDRLVAAILAHVGHSLCDDVALVLAERRRAA